MQTSNAHQPSSFSQQHVVSETAMHPKTLATNTSCVLAQVQTSARVTGWNGATSVQRVCKGVNLRNTICFLN